jgi:peptidyl-prolyl cis-trans isomerase C
MKTLFSKFILAILIMGIASTVAAQDSGRVLATVNGVKITSSQLDQFISLATAQGAQDTKELRQNFLNDLVVREAISQNVKKTGLLTKGSNALKLKIAEQDAITGLWFAQYFAEHPISDESIRAEYDRQITISKDPRNSKEYQISQIVVATEADARQVLNQLKSGTSFDLLAQEKSVDKASAQNGGMVGWVLPSQLSAPMNELVTGLGKGEVISKPVQVGSAWYVVKVNDLRSFIMPSFDQSRTNIAQGILQKQRRDAIQTLLQNAKVVQGQ